TPVGGGVSGDGLHGFTFGAMAIKRSDGANALAKYLAYWVKGSNGWRVAAYKRVARAEGDVSTALMPPLLPARLVDPTQSPAIVAEYRASLVAAEQGFSDLAQKIGLGPAFAATGLPASINLGGAANPGFVVGSDAIAKLVQGDAAPTDPRFRWAAD